MQKFLLFCNILLPGASRRFSCLLKHAKLFFDDWIKLKLTQLHQGIVVLLEGLLL